MTNWFDDKARQIDAASITAFGISLTTRHAKAREMAEMLLFAQAAAKAGVNTLVKAVFYDSNSSSCTFELTSQLQENSAGERKLLDAAALTLSQFEWHGTVHHGGAQRDHGR